MCSIFSGCEGLFEVGAYRSDFCLWGWMKSEVYKENGKNKRRIGRSHYE